MRISDWSSDVCSSDLARAASDDIHPEYICDRQFLLQGRQGSSVRRRLCAAAPNPRQNEERRSEEHTSELQSLMRISYAVFCLKKKTLHTAVHGWRPTDQTRADRTRMKHTQHANTQTEATTTRKPPR